MPHNFYSLYQTLERVPFGNRVASLGLRVAAPYFLTAPMKLNHVEPGHVDAVMKHVPWNRNHLGTVHAIALCNLAEFAMGAVAEATVPADTHRWIPKGMSVQYLAKAKGTMHAKGTLTLPAPLLDKQDVEVPLTVTDTAGTEVFSAVITIQVSAKPKLSCVLNCSVEIFD